MIGIITLKILSYKAANYFKECLNVNYLNDYDSGNVARNEQNSKTRRRSKLSERASRRKG